MSDTMRSVRAAMTRLDRRVGGFSMPFKRFAPRPWWPVHPWGYYGQFAPGRKRRKRSGRRRG